MVTPYTVKMMAHGLISEENKRLDRAFYRAQTYKNDFFIKAEAINSEKYLNDAVRWEEVEKYLKNLIERKASHNKSKNTTNKRSLKTFHATIV